MENSSASIKEVLSQLRSAVTRAEQSLGETKNYFARIGITFEDLDKLVNSDLVSSGTKEKIRDYELNIEREIEEDFGLQKRMFPGLGNRKRSSGRKRMSI